MRWRYVTWERDIVMGKLSLRLQFGTWRARKLVGHKSRAACGVSFGGVWGKGRAKMKINGRQSWWMNFFCGGCGFVKDFMKLDEIFHKRDSTAWIKIINSSFNYISWKSSKSFRKKFFYAITKLNSLIHDTDMKKKLNLCVITKTMSRCWQNDGVS